MMSPLVETMLGTVLGVESEAVRLRGGDVDAIATLMQRYQHRLYRYMLRMVRQPSTAEDLFQQTWLRVMERSPSYDPRRSFEGWLFAIAHNLAIDHLRRRQPESLDEELPSGDTRADLTPGPAADALQQMLAEERSARVAEAVAELPAVARELLTLRFEEEMKLDEIAEILALPLGTVKTRLHRALRSLQKSLCTEPGKQSGQTKTGN
ncbi:MAG: sigma-70 family RNA polymerase sigma factor [Acidobacteriia bacterium]|nr:sigma-70 family RNA polymerase sigma factor [Terriglobia bacterium]